MKTLPVLRRSFAAHWVGALLLGFAAPAGLAETRLQGEPAVQEAAPQAQPVVDVPAEIADRAAPGGLDRALAAIKVERIRADLTFLASDELRGRDSPSPEQRIAARYLRARLQLLGFQPGARDGFFHEYKLNWRAIDPRASSLSAASEIGTVRFEFGADYFLGGLRDAADLDLTGGVVWGGDAAGAELEDLAAAGKWILCLDGGEAVGRRRLAARRAGARGLVVMPSADYSGDEYGQRYQRVTEQVLRGSLSYPTEAGPVQAAEVFATVALPREAGLRLLALSAQAPTEGVEDWVPERGADLGIELLETRRTAGDSGQVVLENVCGFWPGSDPLLSREVILISAHYDHVGARGSEIYNGADDNASGTSGVLAIADALAAHGPLERSVLLIWVSAEEKGLLGSQSWADDPWLPGERRAVANINMDMIGRNAPEQLLFTPTRARSKEYGHLSRLVEEFAPLEGFTRLDSADSYYDRSDQAMFARLGIPVLFLFTDVHEDYHQPTDTVEKIDFDKMQRVVRVVLRLLDNIQTGPLRTE